MYALVGMGTAFAGIVRAPMTSVLMIFEITRDYSVIVPLMISNLVSLFISARLQPQPIYEVLAYQDGIHLPTAESRSRNGLRLVVHAMRPPAVLLEATMTPQQALEKVSASEFRAWAVNDNRGVIGVVTRSALQQAAADGDSKKLNELLEDPEFPHVHSDQSLAVALERMGAAHVDALPVVSRADVHKLEGSVALEDILKLYGLAPQPDAREK
jgi:CIC family chloride channel protein